MTITGLVVFFELLKTFLFLRTDPDAQHSGFVYAQSIAVSDGLLPNKNFLSPYGVTGPAINGIWLNFTADSLLSLLLFYGLITVFSGYLIQRNSSRYIGRNIAILLNVTWVFTLATTTPWPSVLSTFLCLLAFTILIENRSKFESSAKTTGHFLLPVVFALQLSVFTRIQLLLVPLSISIYLILKNKSLNKSLMQYWFFSNFIIGATLLTTLNLLGILSSYIYQAIIWPFTDFSHPSFNLSWWFSLVWFPLSLLSITFLALFGVRMYQKSKVVYQLLFVAASTLVFFIFYKISTMDFVGSNTDTLRTFPGMIKNASVNFQFIFWYCAGLISVIGLFSHWVSLWKYRSTKTQSTANLEKFLLLLMGFTGISQLYPLRDNVHLWYVAPLLIIPTGYLLSVHSFFTAPIKNVFVAILSTFILVQSIAFYNYVSPERKPLKSYELRGMFANSKLHLDIDRSMQLLSKQVEGRVLRNNCVDSLFSVSNGKFVSVDGNFSSNSFGNFTQNVPIVDPAGIESNYIFECGISDSQVQENVREGLRVIFQQPVQIDENSKASSYNVLFARK